MTARASPGCTIIACTYFIHTLDSEKFHARLNYAFNVEKNEPLNGKRVSEGPYKKRIRFRHPGLRHDGLLECTSRGIEL